MTDKKITTEEFDRLFDEGSDEIDKYVDWDSFRRVGDKAESINLDVPEWMVAALDREAKLRGITRQTLITIWISEHLDRAA